MSKFVVGYKQPGANVNINSWVGHSAHETLDQARQAAEQWSQSDRVLAVGVWPARHWSYGIPTCKPSLLIDKSDKSGKSIKNLGGLINSLDSSWF